MFPYSTLVDPSTYETEGLCDGIEVRISKYTEREDRGAIRAHADWNKYVGPCREYRGTLGPTYSFMSLTVPECLPDRLEVISYANEFAFLHDDVTDHVDFDTGEAENNEFMDTFLEAAHTGTINTNNTRDEEARQQGKRRIQAQLFEEMLAIDPICAKATMKAWARFVEVGSSRQHETRFSRLEDYLPYRIMDVGEMFWYGVVTFGLGLRIPDHEIGLCRDLMSSAWIAVGLQNDLWSWPKERDAAERAGKNHVINAIWVLMQEHRVDVEGAMQICRRLIKEYVAKYVKVVEETRKDESISPHLRQYVDAMKFSISGNVIWSRTCPRYNPHANFNEKQLDWMHNGVPPLEKMTVPLPEERESVSSASPSSDSLDSEAPSPRPSSQSSHESSDLDPKNSVFVESSETMDIAAQMAHEKAVLEAPYDYIASLPSKGFRDLFTDALNFWLQVPSGTVQKIKNVGNLLHNASLILDDIQDGSPLRRGKPAAHTIFGSAQAVNSASYTIVRAIDQVNEFADPQCGREVIKDIMCLFQGQAMDLFWIYNSQCPTLEDYSRMVQNKTGKLFGIIARLMFAEQSSSSVPPRMDNFISLLGRYFQIRDDYKNLTSADYAEQKGFCEDLDEGKYSVPLIYTLSAKPNNIQLLNLLSTGKRAGKMAREQKMLVLDIMERAGAFKYTRSVLKSLEEQIFKELRDLELECGYQANTEMRVLLRCLSI